MSATTAAFSLVVGGFAFGLSQPAGAATTWYVGPGGGAGNCATPTLSTIQPAVNGASAGDTIQVCAGTYSEQVNINKALIVLGAQNGVAGNAHSGSESIVEGFNVTNANVTIDGFKIDPGSNNSGVGMSFSGGTSETVQNNIVSDYGYDSANHHGSEGVVFSGTSGMLFQRNVLESPTLTGQTQFSNAAAQDGIFAASGVSNNTQILNNVFVNASTYPGTDIGLSYTSGLNPVISGNTSTGGATFVTVFNSTGALVIGNSFVTDPNISGTAIYIGGGDTNTTVSNNTASGGFTGVAVKNDWGDGPSASTTITGNTLINNYAAGISIGLTAINSNSSVVANGNNLGGYSYTSLDTTCVGDGVATCGARNLSSNTIDVTNNYWGNASGPFNASTNPNGTGSPVTALENYSPWWTTLNGLPTASTAVSATGGTTSAIVSWTAPTLSGTSDSTIASYSVTASGGGSQDCTTTGATTCTVSGLVSGRSYTFSVIATNSVGGTGSSTTSNSVTLAVPPPPPTPTTTTTAPTTGPVNAAPPPGVPVSSLGTPVSVTVSSTAPSTLTQSSQGTSAIVTVPAGALPAGTTVSVYPVADPAPLIAVIPAGQAYVAALTVSWQAPNGSSPPATAPITMTINDPSIVAGDTIYEVTTGGLLAVGTAVTNGTVVITFTSDPTFVVAAPMQVAQVPIAVTSLIGTVGTTLALTTSGGSGTGAISYSVTNGTARGCHVTASVFLSALSAGTCVVTVTKASDASDSAASSVPTTITMVPTAAPASTSTHEVTFRIPFTFYSSSLSTGEKNALIALSKKLTPGTSVTFTGYADFDIPLALRRATAVSHFLGKLVRIHGTVNIVTNVGVRQTTITYEQIVKSMPTVT